MVSAVRQVEDSDHVCTKFATVSSSLMEAERLTKGRDAAANLRIHSSFHKPRMR